MYHSHNHGHSHDHSHDDTCNSNDVTLSDVNIDADDVQPTDVSEQYEINFLTLVIFIFQKYYSKRMFLLQQFSSMQFDTD